MTWNPFEPVVLQERHETRLGQQLTQLRSAVRRTGSTSAPEGVQVEVTWSGSYGPSALASATCGVNARPGSRGTRATAASLADHLGGSPSPSPLRSVSTRSIHSGKYAGMFFWNRRFPSIPSGNRSIVSARPQHVRQSQWRDTRRSSVTRSRFVIASSGNRTLSGAR